MAQSYYIGHPNENVSAVIAAIAALSLVGHTYQNSQYKFWRVTFFMFYAGLVYAAGWIIRCISIKHPGNLALYITQSVLIYLAPPIYSAAEYNILGRVMHYVPMHAVLDPNRVVYIFISLSVIVEVLTAVGALWIPSAQEDNNLGLYRMGVMCIAIAVLLQALAECGFLFLVATVHRRCVQAKMLPRNLRSTFIMLYGTSTLILIRCVFRAVESLQMRDIVANGRNMNTALLTHEWPLYTFDALPVLLYTYWLNFVHPGRFLPSNSHQYLDFDGKTERMGPGWDNKTPRILRVCDPCNIIGILSPKRRDKFYLRADEWPETEKSFACGTGSNVQRFESSP